MIHLLFLLQIDVVIEDKEFLESSMNGEPWKAGKFSHSLRCFLWAEHLGLHAGEVRTIEDHNVLQTPCLLNNLYQFLNLMSSFLFASLKSAEKQHSSVIQFCFYFLQISRISDPLADTAYRDVWQATAEVHRTVYFKTKHLLLVSIFMWSVFDDFDSRQSLNIFLLIGKHPDLRRCLRLHSQ